MSLPLNNYQVDLSELEGRKFTCLDGCGLCCLCQPELLEQEVTYFKRNHPDHLVAKKQPHKHFALSLKKKVGSCAFLNSRRCDVYNIRPHYCRQFPFHIYVGSRVQVELDLSCRGVWVDKGEDCMSAGARLISDNETTIRPTYEKADEVYRQFFKNCLDMECDCRPNDLRTGISKVTGSMSDLAFISSLLEASAEEEKVDLATFKPTHLDTKRSKELEEAATEAAMDSLGSPDPFNAPIYCAEDNGWNMFRFEDDTIERYMLSDDGDLDHISSIDPSTVVLKEPTASGKKVMQNYVAMLNRRDSLMGNAFYLMDDYAYEDYVANIYYGVLATSVLEVLWRSSLISQVFGTELDARGIREGIMYYDMDRLDAPTIGAFM
ncbi:MAG: YkgJ family cysteine cluster protein [Methanomassiliicoccales archaeon]|jgi:Fe-S-cluster containining protein